MIFKYDEEHEPDYCTLILHVSLMFFCFQIWITNWKRCGERQRECPGYMNKIQYVHINFNNPFEQVPHEILNRKLGGMSIKWIHCWLQKHTQGMLISESFSNKWVAPSPSLQLSTHQHLYLFSKWTNEEVGMLIKFANGLR